MDATRAGSPRSPARRSRRIGRIMLIVGNLLILATFFLPWLELETNFCASGPRCRYHYGPWYLIQPGIPGFPLLSPTNPFLLILAGEAIILACSVVCLTSQSRKAQRLSLGALFVPCVVCVITTIVIMTILPFGLVTSYPFFHAAIAYGVWLALLGFLGIFAGAVLVWPE